MSAFNPTKGKDRLFKIKKFQSSTYEVSHPNATGQLRLTTVVTNILEVPDEFVPPEQRTPDLPTLAVSAQTIVAFSSTGKKLEPSTKLPSPQEIKTLPKEDITSFSTDLTHEPWNEFVIQGTPPLVLKQRTIMLKLELIKDYVTPMGDPYLWANHNSPISVSLATTGESGLE